MAIPTQAEQLIMLNEISCVINDRFRGAARMILKGELRTALDVVNLQERPRGSKIDPLVHTYGAVCKLAGIVRGYGLATGE